MLFSEAYDPELVSAALVENTFSHSGLASLMWLFVWMLKAQKQIGKTTISR